jgi:glycerophosphoryl diester phosphodiesterase
MLAGFDWAALIHARKREPDIPCWFTTRPRDADAPRFWTAGYDPKDFGGSVPKAIAAAGGQGWLCSLSEATPDAVDGAHAHGLQFAIWNANEEDEMRRFAALGVDALCTDRPDRAAGLFSLTHIPSNSAVEV